MDAITAVGSVRVIKRDARTGEVIFDEVFKNQITNFARGQAAALWAGQIVPVPSMIAVGTGSPPQGQTGTTANDTALWNECPGSRKQIDYAQPWLGYYTQYSVTYQQTEVLGTITQQNMTGQITLTEAGLFDVNGNMWAHVMLNNVTHDNTSTLSIQWMVLQQGN